MKIKSLVLTIVALALSLSAYAFPTATVTYPSNASPLSEAQYFAAINLSFSESGVEVNTAKKPFFFNEETGDEVYSVAFMNLSGTYLVTFEDTEFTSNGTWTLTFPAGAFTFNSEESPRITFSFVLNDPALASGGSYPQITLVSVDPANNTTHPSWGGDLLNKVSFVTSDDSAVNYIGWTLWDVTDGEAEGQMVYIREGSENRIDVNRTHSTEDQWVNGLFISIGGEPEALIEGHKYRLDLQFCGIGYNPDTNQYPSPADIKKSLELATSVYYLGQTKPTAYSPYTVELVTPDPENYEIESLTQNEFMIVYSGPVQPTKFIYSPDFATTASAGTFRAENDDDEDGYASTWTFIFSDSVLESALGDIHVNITAIDADGLPVKGNGGYTMNDFDYSMSWKCNLGADNIMSVEPTDGSEVEELSSITVACETGKIIQYSYSSEGPAQILNRTNHEVVRELGQPEASSDDMTCTWSFDPITEPGTYVLYIPSYYFVCGTEYSSTSSKSTTFTYIVVNGQSSSVAFDLEPKAITPEDSASIESLDMIKVEFEDVTFAVLNAEYEYTKGILYKLGDTADNAEVVVEVTPEDDPESDFFNPTIYDYKFETPVTDAGTYQFVIPEGSFGNDSYDMSGGESGRANAEIVITYIIGNGGGGIVSIMGDNETANVYSISGSVVARNAGVEQIRSLESGIYIINGKKVVVRK